MHTRAARAVGLRLRRDRRSRGACESKDPREAALLRWLGALLDGGKPPMHLHEEAREAGWDDEELLEAIAAVALERFTAMVNVAGEVPVDGSVEESRTLQRRLTPRRAGRHAAADRLRGPSPHDHASGAEPCPTPRSPPTTSCASSRSATSASSGCGSPTSSAS